jgi:glycerol-3-phosphate acyltransferase PlsY
MILALLFVGAYFLGAIPVGFLVGKAQGIDIRAVGSGNIGATNVLRVLGKGPAYMVFALDVCKGLIPSVAAKQLGFSNDLSFLIGMGAVLGHSVSPFLGFKGGKGIATGLGALLGSVTLVGLSAFGIFFIFMALTLIVSLSSIAAAISLPIWGLVFGESSILTGALLLMGIYIISRHRANIERIRAKNEPKIGQKSVDEPSPPLRSRVACVVIAVGLAAAVVTLRQKMTHKEDMPVVRSFSVVDA